MVEKRQKERKIDMNHAEYTGYIDRMEDLGQQLLDLVAEMRADPPKGWPRPGLGAVPILGECCDVPTKGGLLRG